MTNDIKQQNNNHINEINKNNIKKTATDNTNNNTINKDNTSKNQNINFSMFISSIAHQAFMALGLLKDKKNNNTKVNLKIAKESIDLLQLLKEKTKGNLDNNEIKMIDNILYQLKISFININKQ